MRAKAHGQPGNRPWGSTRFEFDNRAPSAPNAGSACHASPMVCVRAGWVCNHLSGPATLSVWQSQFYMMRFDITQPISHQSKMLISFATKDWRHNFDEAQEDSEERFNRAEAFDQYKTVAGYRTPQAQTQAGARDQ